MLTHVTCFDENLLLLARLTRVIFESCLDNGLSVYQTSVLFNVIIEPASLVSCVATCINLNS